MNALLFKSIEIVDKALISIDKDKTQCATLTDLADKYSSSMSYISLMVEIKILIQYQKLLFAEKKESVFGRIRR